MVSSWSLLVFSIVPGKLCFKELFSYLRFQKHIKFEFVSISCDFFFSFKFLVSSEYLKSTQNSQALLCRSYLFSPELIKPYETIALNVHEFQFKFLRIHSLILRIVLILKWKCFLLFYLRIFTRFADLMAFVIRLVVLRFILRLPFYSRAKKKIRQPR